MNKGRLVLGIGLIAISLAIYAISSFANLDASYSSGDDEKVITITPIDSIHSIIAEGAVNVHISTSDSETVRCVYNKTCLNNRTTFENGKLIVHFPSQRKGFNLFGFSNDNAQVYISAKKLKQIQMNGIGSIESTNQLKADAMRLINEGTGSINLELQAKNLIARNTGVGSINIEGGSDSADIANQGVGSINAERFIVQYLDVSNEGVGSMDVNAEKEIKIRNSGVGSVRYGGDAEVITKRSEGIGSISKN